MIKLDEKKLVHLKTGTQHLAEKYGEKETPSREDFDARAKAWYFADLLRAKTSKAYPAAIRRANWQKARICILA